MFALSPPGQDRPSPEWRVEPVPVTHAAAMETMEAHVADIAAHRAPELLWLLEHRPVITAGTSAEARELMEPDRFPVVRTGRGGRYTYHGPGQRVVYAMIDLAARGRDVRHYVHALEGWAISALGDFGIEAFTSDAGVGIWVKTATGDAKIGAIGVRVRRWVTFHGMAINVSTDLSAYDAIIPCGIADRGVCRLVDLVPGARMADLDAALARHAPEFLAGILPPSAAPSSQRNRKSLEEPYVCG